MVRLVNMHLIQWCEKETASHQHLNYPCKVDPSIGTIGTNGKEVNRFVYWYCPVL